MRKLIAFLLILALVGAAEQIVVAAPGAECRSIKPLKGTITIDCGGSQEGQGGSGSGGVVPVDTGAIGPAPAYFIPSQTLGEDGNACVRMTYIGSDTPSPVTEEQIEQVFIDQMGYYPACPDQEALPGAALITPAIAATSFWVTRPLPAATAEIPPGTMIVGLPAYLVTNAQLADTFDGDSPFGPVRVDATSHLTVDWGDDTTTGPHHTPGHPYPNGDIAHNYQHSGTYDLVITQHWTATWSIGEGTGTVPTRTVTTRIDDFPVEQLQAVRNY